MSSMVTSNQFRRATETRIVTIDQVDMTKLLVTGLDNYGTRLQVSIYLHGGVTDIPAPGDVWQVTRQDNEWWLNRKADSGEERTGLVDLQPGDKRIETSNNLHLISGGEVNINADGVVNIDGVNINLGGGVSINNRPIRQSPGFMLIW